MTPNEHDDGPRKNVYIPKDVDAILKRVHPRRSTAIAQLARDFDRMYPKRPTSAFAVAFVGARKARGKSQAEVATALGLKRSTVATWEAGRGMLPSDETASYAADMLGVPRVQLLEPLERDRRAT